MVLGFISVLPFSQGISSTNMVGPCKCVVFRMDGIQDYWIESGQIAPMDLFISKNQDLSLGLIMHQMGNESKIINKVSEGVHKGLFELAVHGWDYLDYTKLSEQDQKESLYNASEKMRKIFGNNSNIYIPPESTFNSITVKAMNDLGIGILSSSIWEEDNFDQKKSIFNASKIFKTQTNDTINRQIYHLPETISFKKYEGGKWIKNSIKNIIDNATNNIGKYGYAVIVIHPQDFVRMENRTFVDKIDENEVKDLSDIVDSLISKNITISSFSKITGTESNVCMSGFNVTGYYTPVESDYHGINKVTVNIVNIGEKKFDTEFIRDVKIEGWGKTGEGWYIGYYNGNWVKSAMPLDVHGNPLTTYSSVAVDSKVIPQGAKVLIPTLMLPYKKTIFLAKDVGGSITGKHIDIYTGEGKLAQLKTLSITTNDNVVCYNNGR